MHNPSSGTRLRQRVGIVLAAIAGVAILIPATVLAAVNVLDTPGYLSHNVAIPVYHDLNTGGVPSFFIERRCTLNVQHGNYAKGGTTAYTNTKLKSAGSATLKCTHVSGRASYLYNGNIYNASTATTSGGWVTSQPSGANRYIVGSGWWSKRTGVYSVYNSSSGI